MILINNIEINPDVINDYINHFGKNKKDIWDWERKRKQLHDNIFKSINLERLSVKGQEFSKQLDKYCIPKIEKLDYFAADLKRISSSTNKTELLEANIEIRKKQLLRNLGIKNDEIIVSKNCRICDKELVEGVGRINDHLVPMKGEKPKGAICSQCSEYNPDEYHEKFRKIYWNK